MFWTMLVFDPTAKTPFSQRGKGSTVEASHIYSWQWWGSSSFHVVASSVQGKWFSFILTVSVIVHLCWLYFFSIFHIFCGPILFPHLVILAGKVISSLKQVHARADNVAVGKLSLNLTCISKEIASVFGTKLSTVIKNLLPFTKCIPLTVEYLNSASLAPKKDYQINR